MKILNLLIFFCLLSPKAMAQSKFQPGETVPDAFLVAHDYKSFFLVTELPDSIFSLMQRRSWKEYTTIRRSSLRYLLCLHKDINGRSIVGEMVLNKTIADRVLNILRELYENDYPIERMRLIDYWDADDEKAMRANNSSGFNFRFVSNTKVVSKHGLGLAVDINPLYNPYCKTVKGKRVVEPQAGIPYAARTKTFDYKIEKGDLCYHLFTANGFQWGGNWRSCKDYQHFELRQ